MTSNTGISLCGNPILGNVWVVFYINSIHSERKLRHYQHIRILLRKLIYAPMLSVFMKYLPEDRCSAVPYFVWRIYIASV
jgi:hypothetical protein